MVPSLNCLQQVVAAAAAAVMAAAMAPVSGPRWATPTMQGQSERPEFGMLLNHSGLYAPGK